jgi:large subunit ribosomal protein L25
MALVELTAQLREERGSGAAHRIRFGGGLPGVVYGQGGDNLTISVQQSDFDRLLRQAAGGTVVVDLQVEGAREKNLKVLIRDVQRDPVTSRPIHLDFLRISMDKPVQVIVPVHLTGLAEGVKTQGGFMDHVLREVEVQCLPDRIPQYLEVDVTPLAVGQSLHVRDLQVEGLQVITSPDRVIVSVHGKAAEPVAEAEAVVAAEAAPAEGAEAAGEKTGEKAAEKPTEKKGKDRDRAKDKD